MDLSSLRQSGGASQLNSLNNSYGVSDYLSTPVQTYDFTSSITTPTYDFSSQLQNNLATNFAIDSAKQSIYDSINYSNNLDTFLDTYDTDYTNPDTYIDLTTELSDTDFAQSLIDNSYGGDFDGLDIDSIGTGINIDATFDYLDGVDINADDFSDYDASTQFAAQDISSFDEGELDILKSVGAIEMNEDGAVTNFNSGDALRQIEDQLIEYREDLSDTEIAQLTSLRNEILAAEDLGLESFDIDLNQPSTALAGEGGSVGNAGTMFSNGFLFSGDDEYKENNSDVSTGFINEGNANRNSQVYANTGGGYNIYGEPVDMRTNPALYGMQFQTRTDQSVPGSIIQGVDTMTDYLRDGAGMLLKPVNWVTDAIGGGLNMFGETIGNNPIGRGFSSFGNIIDNSGDYFFGSGDRDSLLGTVFNVPDNLAMAGVGGLSGNWDVAKQGLKGLVAAPLEVAGNVLSVPIAVAKDVFGVDKIDISASAGAGGGGGGRGRMPKRPPPARKRIGSVLNKGSGSREGITGVNGSSVSYGGKEYDMSTEAGQRQLLQDSDFGTLTDGIAQAGGTNLLSDAQIRGLAGIGSAPMSGTADDPIGSTDVDRSSLADKVEEKQGGGAKVKKSTTTADIKNIIDELAKGSVRNAKPAPMPTKPLSTPKAENMDPFDNEAPFVGEED